MTAESMTSTSISRRAILKSAAAIGTAAALQTAATVERSSAAIAQDNVTLSYAQIGGQVYQDLFEKTIFPTLAEDHPHISVEQTMVGGWEDLYQLAVVGIAGGNPPDAIRGKEFWLGDFASRNALLNLNDYVAKSEYISEEKFQPEAWQGTQYEGAQVALPLHIFVRFLFYNKDLLEAAGVEVPSTWEEVSAAATKISDPSKNIWGTMLYNYEGGEDMVNHFNYGLRQAGGTLWDDAAKSFAFNSPEGLETLQWHISQLESGAMLPMDSTTEQVVESGSIGIWYSAAFGFANYAAQAPDLNYGVTLCPENDNRGGIIRANNLYAFRESKNPDAAFALIEHLEKPEINLEYGKTAAYITALLETQDAPFYQQDERWKVALEQARLPENEWQSHFRGYPEAAAAIGSELHLAYLGQKTPEQALADAEAAAEAVLQSVG